MEEFGDYCEEEEITYLPIDDHFCQITELSIFKAVSQVVAHMEKKIQELQAQCQKPLNPREDSQVPQYPLPGPKTSSAADLKRKHREENRVDVDALVRLKKAFMES
ncbi:hypothetical protein NDU88_001288 [Pleurodeles waltl]|uniref:Uncharacterized protein n=1 Tax=Pleurodeles waltl TaxID=8319 RepID=A0AAV7SZL1_PLEWA|nr:hypothetical protein NDU88_001288 [Pleurodeles waltl]